MDFFRNLSIKNKLLLIILAVTVFATASIFLFMVLSESSQLRSELEKNTRLSSDIIADYLSERNVYNGRKIDGDKLLKFTSLPCISDIIIYNPGKEILYSTFTGNDDDTKCFCDTSFYKNGFYYYSREIKDFPGFQGYLILRTSTDAIESTLSSYEFSLVMIIAVVMLISYILALFLQRIITKPILKLSEITANISENREYSRRISPKGKDEIGKLLGNFNEMMDKFNKWRHERDEAEEALRISENRYRNLVEFSPTPIFVHSGGEFLYMNKATLRLYGYDDFSELKTKKMMDYVHPDSKEYFSDLVKKAQRNREKLEDIQLKINSIDGSILDIEANSMPINFEGTDARIVICNDVTRRKRAEEQIRKLNQELEERVKRRTEQLEKALDDLKTEVESRRRIESKLRKAKEDAETANRLKSEFLANVSHEIRTPMNAILGFSELLIESLGNDSRRNYVKTIMASGNILINLITDILDLSKIESGNLVLDRNKVNIRTIIKEIRKVYLQKIESKSLECIIDINPDFPKLIFADEKRLRQIIYNLVGNAVKFTKHGYIIIRLNYQKKAGNLINYDLEIKDSGIGFRESKDDEIFQAFWQQAGQSIREYGGTGLGLAITKRLTELMGGSIMAESREGKGSTFKVSFYDVETAKHPDEILERPGMAGMAVDFSNCSVLLVDDYQFSRQLVKDYIKDTNIVLTEADNADKAFDYLKNENPDLILMDMKMPGTDGNEAARIIKTDMNLGHVPIVAITAVNAVDEEISEYLDGYLTKPFNRDSLFKELIKFLPHKLTRLVIEELSESNNNAIPEQMLEKIPELIGILETNFYYRWSKIKDTIIIDELQEFSNELHSISIKYKIPSLIFYARNLLDAVINFNISKIKKYLPLFPEEIDGVKKLLNRNKK